MARRVLRDGTPCHVRRVTAADHEQLRTHLRSGFDQLSDSSRHHRFHAAMPRLTSSMLDHLVEDVDDIDHVAVACFAAEPPGGDQPVGIARMIRYPQPRDTADLAVTVVDRWQRRGVATVLLRMLADTRPRGVRRVATEVAADNPGAVAMLRPLGPLQVERAGPGLLHVDIALDPPPEPS